MEIDAFDTEVMGGINFPKSLAETILLQGLVDFAPLKIPPDASLQTVVSQMGQTPSHDSLDKAQASNPNEMSHHAYALILSDSQLQGIFTEFDILRCCTQGLNLAETTLAQVISVKPVTLKIAELHNISVAADLLNQEQIQHLPLLGDQGEVLGVLTADRLHHCMQKTTVLKRSSIQTVMQTQVVKAPATLSAMEVVQRMEAQQASEVVLLSPTHPSANHSQQTLGVITARDIIQAQISGIDLHSLPANRVKSQPLASIRPADSLWDAHRTMQQQQVKYLSVIDINGHLAGLIHHTHLHPAWGGDERDKTMGSLQPQVIPLQTEQCIKTVREQTQAKENLRRASEDSFRATFEQAAVGIAQITPQGNWVRVNQKLCNILGYSRRQLTQLTSQAITVPADLEIDQSYFQQLVVGEITTCAYEKRYIREDQTEIWTQVTLSAVYGNTDDPKALPHQGRLDYLICVVEDISAHKRLETRLRSAENQMRGVFESMRDLVLICSMQAGDTLEINLAPTHPQYEDVGDVLQSTTQYLLDETHKEGRQKIQEVLTTGHCLEFEYSLYVNDRQLWFLATVSPMSDDSILWVARDICDRKQAEQELFQEKELAQVTLRSIGDAVITTDIHGNITNFNPVAERLTGWQTAEVRGHAVHESFHIVNEDTREPVLNPIKQALQEQQTVALANGTILIARDGREYAIENSAAPICDLQGQVVGAVMVFHDVTKARTLTHQLSWQATHDPLTRLVNRLRFNQLLQTAIQSAYHEDLQHVLCFLDLDKFKIINDTCGHAAGDELLCQVSQLLQKSIRSTDTLARLGGDEFAILLYRCPLENAKPIAEKICQTVRDFRFHWVDKVFSIGVSIGVVEIHNESPALESVLSTADAACYVAKERGRNRVHIHQENDTTLQQQRGQKQWRERILEALAENRFCLYGQPIVPVSSASGPYAYEILLRMIDKQGNIINADAFIPAAERFNLITELDQWVLKKFLSEYDQLRETSPPQSQVSQYMINISGTSINDEQFLPFLQTQLQKHPEIAQHICFEITETAAISNLNQARQLILQLKKLGCQFALDDFGSAMSAFAYLKALPVDYLKIDGRFIEEVVDDPATIAIVESINHVGHVMGMKTIAEFVSSRDIHDKLQGVGVDYVQGYEISRPAALTAPSTTSTRVPITSGD